MSFSSFPPQFNSFPDLEPGPSQHSQPNEIADSRKRHKRKDKEHKDKKRKIEPRTHDEPGRHASRAKRRTKGEDAGYGGVDDEQRKAAEDNHARADALFSAGDTRPGDPPLYFTDRKGDPLNVQYGRLHAGDVPRYYLVGRGKKVLGLPDAWSVVHRGRSGIEVAVGGKRKMPALTDPHSRHLLAAAPTRRLLSTQDNKYKYEEVEGFLRLSTRRERTNDQSYRAITAPKREHDTDSSGSSSDEEEESVDDDSDTTPQTSLQLTSASIPTWLALLAHTLSTIPIMSKNAPRARAEITLSVLGRALGAHPRNATSRALRLRYLKAGEEIWHESKLRAEWEEALKVGGENMWIEWLDWRVRKADKGVEGVVEDAQRVLSALGDGEDAEMAKLRASGELVIGFMERATALFQAQAELTFRAPSTLVIAPLARQLDALEEFWEAEVPRIGEVGATGWAKWEASGRPLYIPESSVPIAADSTISDADPYTRWAAAETLADQTHQLPTRTLSSGADESDPYATILFSDLRPLLFLVRSPRAQDALRLIWLAFLGLHVPGFTATFAGAGESTDDRWTCAHLVTPARLAEIFPAGLASRVTADAQAGVLVGREREYASAFGPVRSWGYGVLGPLEGVRGGEWRMWMKEDVSGVDANLVREIFRQCRTRAEDPEWDVLVLAFEAAVNLKGAIKISKAFLASARDSLPLWAAHARLERLRGRVDDARKVYETMFTSQLSRHGEGCFWWDWAEMEWLARDPDAALQVIVRSAGAEGTGGIAILRARRYLDEVRGQVPATAWKDHEAWIKLRVLLELLTTSPQAALSVIDSQLAALEPGTVAHESLTVSLLLMLYHYGLVLRNPVPPALLRGRVEQVMETYPSNTVVLGMFLEAEKGQGIWGRVRAMLGGESTESGPIREKDVARRVAEVWISGWEKSRWEAERERTRGGLSVAVQDARTRGSAVLWRLYVEFEIRNGELQRAKKLLFRAVGECPLTKELYLMAFGRLRSVFSAGELNAWAETMAERGLRMRRGLEEELEGWAGEAALGEEDGEAEDEIEERARELRRLLPY
ncbi:NRDE-2, necessary for RNA interference-domain-containing protein [Amylocystis lapponica]|nr:NRDE-2, necessary for RNA interference-domain-containing protein [Amylocystis lapponica]